MTKTEIEKRYLVRFLPDLKDSEKVEMIDVYMPEITPHAKLRARKIGSKYELTKKVRKTQENQYVMTEQTIEIVPEEFDFIYSKSSRKIEKDRYYYKYNDNIIEIDVFKGKHQGLIIAEVEFKDLQSLEQFNPPEFFGKEINKVEELAGGVLSGLSYEDLKNFL